MAQIVVRKFTCDRCKKPYNETETDAAADKIAGTKVIFTLESHISHPDAPKVGPELVKFEDLCAGCQKRVTDLIGQIRLDKGKDDKDESKDDKSKQDTQSAGPATAPEPAPATTVRVDKAGEKTDNKEKGQRAGGSAEPTKH